ncbi:type-F conjugative transfer system protein TraW, partial [Legionella pneumophila serogroup 1]
FGVVGEVFPIAEKSFLTLIEERLASLKASGELESLNQRWVQTAAEHANRPTALELPRTNRSTRHDYVPEITLSQDIRNEKGRILYSKGTHVNALQQMPSYTPCWLFFNADDETQLNWAAHQKTQCTNPKLILTGGAINTAEKKLNAVIYFDQAGKITTKLHIAHVPAKVT